MSTRPPRLREKAQVLDETALDRALTRIAHEILERNGGAIQDIPVLSDHLQQQCTENSTNSKRDGALSHVLEDVSVLSANSEK